MTPAYPASITPLHYVDMGTDGFPYIVKFDESEERAWMRLSPDDTYQMIAIDIVKNARKKKGGPIMPASNFDEGDVITGVDGNQYIVETIKGKKVYNLHQLNYDWCDTGIAYIKIVDSDLLQEPKSKSRRSKKSSKAKNSMTS